MSRLLGFLPLPLMLIFGIALWSFGRFLRRRGWGRKLDLIDTKLRNAQTTIGRIFGLLGLAWMGVGFTLNHIPLVGSKSSRKAARLTNEKIRNFFRN